MASVIVFLVSTTCTFVSQNGRYSLRAELRGGTAFAAEEFALLDGNTILYQVCDPGVHTFFVSDHGTVFALADRHAVFYSRTGECDTLMPTMYLNNSGFTEQHDLFYLSARDGMYVYTLDGALLYSLAPGRLLASTARGEHIAVVSADTLRLYAAGAVVHTIFLETAYVHGVSFTGSGAVRVEELGDIEVFDMKSGMKGE